MMDDPIKGYVIARFPGRWEDDKRKDTLFTFYPFFGFVTIPLVLLALFISPKITPEIRDIAMLITIPFALIMSVVAFFLFDMVMTRQRSPIIVFSGGIEYKGGYLDRWKHRPDFIPKAMIQKVDVSDSIIDTVKGKETYTSINIHMTNGQAKQAFRKAEKISGFKEAMVKMGAVVCDAKAAAYKSSSSRSAPPAPVQGSQSNNGNNFCGGCGTRLEEGVTFCGKCGRKV